LEHTVILLPNPGLQGWIQLLEKSGMRTLKLSLILLVLTIPMLGTAEQVYRSVNDRGQVIFSDTPPADRPVDVIELAPAPSDRSVKEAESRNQAIRTHLESMQQERQEKERVRASSVEGAEEALQSAENNLIEAREVQDSDWQMTVSGKRHLKPEYFERVEQAEAAVEAARKALREVQSGH
jgi:hypothetical protein